MEKYNISSDTELSKKIGMQQRTVSYYLNGERKPNLEFITKIIESFSDVEGNWLLTGAGSMNIDSTSSILSSTQKPGSTPFYGNLLTSMGKHGLPMVVDNKEEPTGFIMLPGLKALASFPVIGCSFLPLIQPGDVIAVNNVNNWDRVDPDKIYMLVTDEERMIKRLRIDNDDDTILWCVSENLKEFKIQKNEIKFIYHVVFNGRLL